MDFRQALDTVHAELTPQPWTHATPVGTTLTVIPAGLPAAPGEAEVTIRIAAGHTTAAEVGITTAAMPGLLAALEANEAWEHTTVLRDLVSVTPTDDGGVDMTVTENNGPEPAFTATVVLPGAQRLPLASALRRAADVAAGWEQ